MRVWVSSYSQDGKHLAKTLYDQITQLQDKLKQGYRLVPERVNRTNGRTKTLRSQQQKNILDTEISKTLGTDLYKIKFDGKQNIIGIVKKILHQKALYLQYSLLIRMEILQEVYNPILLIKRYIREILLYYIDHNTMN